MDRRQKKTRTAIFNAFIKLLEQKDFYQITVQEIIDEADIGRATFYAHFETKDYLLKGLCEELFEHIINSAIGKTNHSHLYSNCNKTTSVFLHLLEHLKNNDDHMLTLLSCQNNELFLQYFKNELKEMIQIQFQNGQAVNKTDLPEEFLINHISATFVETVTWWIHHKLQESSEEILDYFLKVLDSATEFTPNHIASKEVF